jgi:hypothetical protein
LVVFIKVRIGNEESFHGGPPAEIARFYCSGTVYERNGGQPAETEQESEAVEYHPFLV